MKWEDALKEINSISDAEKEEIALVAELVGKIVSRREQLGLTQKQLADLVAMKQPALARIERGTVIPRLDTVLKLAKALGMKFTFTDEQAASVAVCS